MSLEWTQMSLEWTQMKLSLFDNLHCTTLEFQKGLYPDRISTKLEIGGNAQDGILSNPILKLTWDKKSYDVMH